MSSRAERAARRRREWRAEVVVAGTPKGLRYDSLSVAERLVALARLNRRAWAAAGKPAPTASPRSQWPGEIFEIGRRG